MRGLITRTAIGVSFGLASVAGFAQPLAYVPDPGSGAVTVIDTGTNTIERTLSGISGPAAVGISPSGRYVYVSESGSNQVSVIDAAKITNKTLNPVVGTIHVGSQPGSIVASPGGQTVYVAERGANTVAAIDTSSDTVSNTYAAGSEPDAMAISPDGRFLYVADAGTSSISLLDFAQLPSVVKPIGPFSKGPIQLPAQPFALALSPLGQELYVATASGLTVLNTETGTLTNISIQGGVSSLAVSPDGGDVYLGASSGNTGSVYTYVPATGALSGRINLPGPVSGLDLSPDGTELYAVESCNACGVEVIDTATQAVSATIAFGQRPTAPGRFVGPGPLVGAPSTVTTTSEAQVSGSVTATDRYLRALSYRLVENPSNGTVNFTSSGDWTYSPSAATSGTSVFTWQAIAQSGVGSPNQRVSRPAPLVVQILPSIKPPANVSMEAGQKSAPLSFSLSGSKPLSVFVQSSNTKIIEEASIKVGTGCGTQSLNCTLTLATQPNVSGASIITLFAEDQDQLVGEAHFTVTILGGTPSGGGGALALSGLGALILASVAALLRRRHLLEKLNQSG